MKKIKIMSTLLATVMILSLPVSSYAGVWRYEEPYWMNVENDGTKNTGWYSEGKNDWYHLDANGIMQTGWYEGYHLHEVSDGTKGHMDYGWYHDGIDWYFLNTAHDGSFGIKVTGWQWIDGYCYLFAEDGKMYADTQTPDGYLVNKDGRWIKDGVVQFVLGKGLNSKPDESSSYPSWSGNSGGKVISGGSGGGSSKPVPPSEDVPEKTEDKDENFITLIDNKDLLKLLANADAASSEDEKKDLVLQADSVFAKALENGQIENYKWNESRTAASCEYPNGMVDIFGFWETEYDEFLDTDETAGLEIGTVSGVREKTYGQISENKMAMFSIPLGTLQNGNDATEIENKKAIILSGFSQNGSGNDEVYLRACKNVQQKLNSFPDEDFNCKLEYKATVDDYKTLTQYGMIFINCHGNLDTRGLLYNDEDISVLCIGETVTSDKDKKYIDDLRSRRVLRYISNNKSTYVITPNFIKHYFGNNKLDGAAVYCGMCLGYYTDSLADAFLESGAELFIGYDGSVRVLYEGAILEDMVDSLLNGATFDEALAAATARLCGNDNDYAEIILNCTLTDNKTPASPKLGGNGNIVIVGEKRDEIVLPEIVIDSTKFTNLTLNWFEDNGYVIETSSKSVEPGGYDEVSTHVHKDTEENSLGSSSFVLFALRYETGELVDILIGLKDKEDNFRLAQTIGEFIGINFTHDEYVNAPIENIGFASIKAIKKNNLVVEFVLHEDEKDDYISIKKQR